MEYIRCAGLREGHWGQQVRHSSIFLDINPPESDMAENGFTLQASQPSRSYICRLSDVFAPQRFFGGVLLQPLLEYQGSSSYFNNYAASDLGGCLFTTITWAFDRC